MYVAQYDYSLPSIWTRRAPNQHGLVVSTNYLVWLTLGIDPTSGVVSFPHWSPKPLSIPLCIISTYCGTDPHYVSLVHTCMFEYSMAAFILINIIIQCAGPAVSIIFLKQTRRSVPLHSDYKIDRINSKLHINHSGCYSICLSAVWNTTESVHIHWWLNGIN